MSQNKKKYDLLGKEKPLKLNMSFEEAMKKSLNTPLPQSEKLSKKRKSK